MTSRPQATSRQRPHGTAAWVAAVVAATAVAWTGFYIHNVADLAGQTILSPESLFPSLIWLAAIVLWVVPATRIVGAWVLLAWAALNLVGGVLTVLPLPILPFEPDQSARHYAFHALYAATQIPLVAMTAVWFRRLPRRRR